MILTVKNESGYQLEYATEGSIGLDLRACIGEARIIEPGRRFKFDTGVSIELPPYYGAFVQPRSGMGWHNGVVALTGTIDRDYRGRIGVVLVNHGHDSYKVLPGDKIAQIVLVRVDRATIVEVDELSMTARGESGFGSSGR